MIIGSLQYAEVSTTLQINYMSVKLKKKKPYAVTQRIWYLESSYVVFALITLRGLYRQNVSHVSQLQKNFSQLTNNNRFTQIIQYLKKNNGFVNLKLNTHIFM